MARTGLQQRAGRIFAAVVLGHIILISAQVNSRAGVPVLEEVTFGVFAEVLRAASASVSGVRQFWRGYVDLRGVRAENATLAAQVDQLRLHWQEEHALAERSRQLQDLLDLRDRTNLAMVAADVIGFGASPDFRTVAIGKGTNDGLGADMAVLAPQGVVGRVVTPTARAAKVQLLIDRNAAAGAMVERTRVQGVVLGTGDRLLRMDYFAERGEVRPGDTVVTSGTDGIYPKGFVIGEVETVERSGGANKAIMVRPAVDLQSLESVLVVQTPPPGAANRGDQGDE
jgi:rod shape-determining protein MreC